MPFLSGSLGFERFSVSGFEHEQFGEAQLEQLEKAACAKFQTSSTETTHVGFLGGEHLFDQVFDLGKNVINDAMHCSIRIDTNQVPAAIKKAWMQMELAARAKDTSTGRPTKAHRQEAKEAVEQRCEVEAATGKYRKMQQFPVLWDIKQSLLYFGGSGATAGSHCADLFERTFEIELSRVTAGSVALQWAQSVDKLSDVEDLTPAAFAPDQAYSDVAWANVDSRKPDFLGNEFLLWLWWTLENVSDSITLPDESEVTVMLTKTLTLECPLGEHGKETISHESPVKLVEALQAIRSGKLPRKSGMTLVRFGQQYDLVLQAESFAISGAKIHVDENDEAHELDDRIDAIRSLNETVDLLFHAFCSRRVSREWANDQDGIRKWLSGAEQRRKKPAA